MASNGDEEDISVIPEGTVGEDTDPVPGAHIPQFHVTTGSYGDSSGPSSQVALTTAFNALKARYNKLEQTHRNLIKGLKDGQSLSKMNIADSAGVDIVPDSPTGVLRHVANGELASTQCLNTQSDKEAKSLDMRRQYLEQEVLSTQLKNKEQKDEIKNLKESKQKADMDNDKLSKEVRVLRKDIERLKYNHELEVENMEERIHSIEKENEEYQKKIYLYEKKSKEMQLQVKELERRFAHAQVEVQNKETELKDLRMSFQQQIQQYEDMQRSGASSDPGLSGNLTELQSLKMQLHLAREDITALEKQVKQQRKALEVAVQRERKQVSRRLESKPSPLSSPARKQAAKDGQEQTEAYGKSTGSPRSGAHSSPRYRCTPPSEHSEREAIRSPHMDSYKVDNRRNNLDSRIYNADQDIFSARVGEPRPTIARSPSQSPVGASNLLHNYQSPTQPDIMLPSSNNVIPISTDNSLYNNARETTSRASPLNYEPNLDDAPVRKTTDNTFNVNIYSSNPAKLRDPSPPPLNNDPYSGHKAVSSKNMYDDRLDPEGGLGTMKHVTAAFTNRDYDYGARLCPTCERAFPVSFPMEQFQKHVLDCVDEHPNIAVVPQGITPSEEEKVCPVCNAVFPNIMNYEDFERHVNDHFDDGSITNQFEVLRN